MPSRFCMLLLASFAAVITTGFSVHEKSVGRRAFVQDIVTAVAVGSVLIPQSANADITSQLAAPAALRAIKRARKKISNVVQESVLLSDYTGIKTALRLESISDLRKSCSTILKATDERPNAERILQQYKTMITGLEKLDSLASLGMRGRTLSNGELSECYTSFVASLDGFIEMSETSIVAYDAITSS